MTFRDPSEVPAVVDIPSGAVPQFASAAAILADQKTLLSTVSLRLSPLCKVVKYGPGRVVVKQVPGRAYLHLSGLQWDALRSFGELGLTVPQVLFKLISDRSCPPLREFYEVVLKAVDAAILVPTGGGGSVPADEPAFDWRWSVSPSGYRDWSWCLPSWLWRVWSCTRLRCRPRRGSFSSGG